MTGIRTIHPPAPAEFEALCEAAAAPLCVVDAEGHVAWVNEALALALGRVSADVLGAPLARLLGPGSTELLSAFWRMVACGQPFEGVRWQAPGHPGRWLEWRGRPARGSRFHLAAREVPAAYGPGRDEDTGLAAYEQAPAMMFSFDREGRIVAASDAWLERLGYEREEVVGREVAAFAGPGCRERLRAATGAAAAGAGPRSDLPVEFLRKDGALVEVLLSSVPPSDGVGGFASGHAVLAEIAEGHRPQVELQRYRALMEAFFQALPDAVVITDATRRITRANEAVTRMFGYTEQELRGRTTEVLYADRDGYLQEQERRLPTDGTGGAKYEIDYQRRTGEKFPSETVATAIRGPEGETLGYLGIVRDISQRQRATERIAQQARELERQNAELQLRNDELDQFAHIVSHDLQEPLRKLIAFSELLRQDLPDQLGEQADDDLHYIQDAARRMHRLVQDLLALSRVGRAAVRIAPVALDVVADHACLAVAGRIDEARAIVRRDPLPEVQADRSLLTQVYQNLLSNAVKFVAPGQVPEVTLTAERGDGGWLLGVRDNGIGIDPGYAEEIFAPCKRLHSRAEYEGAGIGLALCRKIVMAHGGRIWVESEVGRGAHFRFTLPDPSPDAGGAPGGDGGTAADA